MKHALYTIDQDLRFPELKPYTQMMQFRTVKEARRELCDWFLESKKCKNADEIQPTMNFKDKYHMYIKDEEGNSYKRTILIAPLKNDEDAYSYDNIKSVDNAMYTDEYINYNYIKRFSR